MNVITVVAPNMKTYFSNLNPIFGVDSFDDPINESTRWSMFLASGLPMAAEFESEFTRLQALYNTACTSANLTAPLPTGILTEPLEGLGKDGGKVHKRCFDLILSTRALALQRRARALPPEDSRRRSFFAASKDRFAHSLFQGHPSADISFSPLEFTTAIQNAFGLPCTCLAPLIGQPVATANGARVDLYGASLKTATGALGGHQTELHNNWLAMLFQDMKKAGIKVSSGKDTFSHQMNANENLSSEQLRWKQGILPDMVVHGGAISTAWEGDGVKRFAGRITLTDVKTLAPGDSYNASVPTTPSKTFGSVVQTRQEKVHKQYVQHARKLDQSKGTPVATKGPLERRLGDFGIEGKVVGLVMGAFGEFSEAVHELADLIATKRANDYCGTHSISMNNAKNMFIQSIKRKWGLFAHRGWAHLLLQRSYGVGCPTHQPNNGSFEPEVQMDMEYHHQHPDRGGGFYHNS